jgi:glycerol-3-phosphate cytidylyltransferase-like family protein
MSDKQEETQRPIIALSGGFDPPSEGQVSMIIDAAKMGDVVIILNSDEWCDRNKHMGVWMPWERRRDVLLNIEGVIDVVKVDDSKGDVCEALRLVKPDFFGNGGSRTLSNTPEVKVCRELGIGMLWLLGNEDAHHQARDMLYKAAGRARKNS